MRPRLKEDLKSFNKVAKEQLIFENEVAKTERDLAEEKLSGLCQVIDWHLNEAAKRQHTNLEVQKEIFGIQKEKQKIMAELKKQLAALDQPENVLEKEPGDRPTKFDEQTQSFMYKDDLGRENLATFGEIITDMDWGVNYSLDTKSTPRFLMKKYLVERAKKKLGELLDLQIIKSEVGGDIAHEKRREVYQEIEKGRKSGLNQELPGFVSEKMVKNLLKKSAIDQEFPFEVHEADVFQDVEQKIDFIIHRQDRLRGVNVEADEKAEDVGVQFTKSQNKEQIKRTQVEKSIANLKKEGGRIKDIALVIFPLTIAKTLEEIWKKNGRPAGGPDKFLYRHVAKKLFIELLHGIFTVEKIDDYWRQVENNFPERF
ncbi:MAG: hypothetical protein PHT40_04850 [Patescibacteria group bacterium]|nr:hypothetical protein [Patescibacteria group bacterium]